MTGQHRTVKIDWWARTACALASASPAGAEAFVCASRQLPSSSSKTAGALSIFSRPPTVGLLGSQRAVSQCYWS